MIRCGMAQNHYDVLENEPHHRLLQGDHMRHAKDQCIGFDAQFFFDMNSAAVFHGQTRSGLRAKSHWNRAKSGPGMQAIFLGPKRKSCGTGVFIPRGHETDLQFTKKPAFSSVLLPSRVIQALNLNVHELGKEIKPQQEQTKNIEEEKIGEKFEKQKEDYISLSPEIFLPEEWTY